MPGRLQPLAHAGRLIDEQRVTGMTVTDIHRAGAALARRGLVVSRTQFEVTRWALTGSGAGYAGTWPGRLPRSPCAAGRTARYWRGA